MNLHSIGSFWRARPPITELDAFSMHFHMHYVFVKNIKSMNLWLEDHQLTNQSSIAWPKIKLTSQRANRQQFQSCQHTTENFDESREKKLLFEYQISKVLLFLFYTVSSKLTSIRENVDLQH